MLHHFDPDIAEAYGVNEAIILYNIAFWVDKNEKNENNFFEGRYWTYNSTKAYKKQFPYMSERTIQRVIKNLIDNGIILSGNFSSNLRDRTHYYTLTDYGASITTKCHIPLRQNGVDVAGQGDNVADSLFNKNTNSADINSTNINNISPISPVENRKLLFKQFWDAYPPCERKVNYDGCEKLFVKIKNLERIFPDIMASLEMWKVRWSKDDFKYVPTTHKWLNQKYWLITDTRTEKQIISDEATTEYISNMFGGGTQC